MNVKGRDRWRGGFGFDGAAIRTARRLLRERSRAPARCSPSLTWTVREQYTDDQRRRRRPPGSKSTDPLPLSDQRLPRDDRYRVCARDDTDITLHRSGDRSVLEAVEPTITACALSFTATNCSRTPDCYDVGIEVTGDLHELFRGRRGISSAENSGSSEYISTQT